MGRYLFDANNDDDVMDVSIVDEAGSVASESSDESIGKVPMYNHLEH